MFGLSLYHAEPRIYFSLPYLSVLIEVKDENADFFRLKISWITV